MNTQNHEEHFDLLERAGSQGLKLDNVTVVDGIDVKVFEMNLSISSGDHVAIIGDESTAKSDVLEIINGDAQVASGAIIKDPKLKVVLVPQNIQAIDDLEDEETVRDTFFNARGLKQVEERVNQLYVEVAENHELMDKLAVYQGLYERMGGYGDAEAELEKILSGLQVNISDHDNISADTPISEASSGQRTKILLGRALFARPDVLLLDNPTAHLDVIAQAWLAQFIKSAEYSIVVATPDTAFAERFANKYVEITPNGLAVSKETSSLGDFTQYRDGILESLQHRRDLAATSLAKLVEQYRRLSGWASNSGTVARKASVVGRQMRKASERLEEMRTVEGAGANALKTIMFESGERLGDIAMRFSGLKVGYRDKIIVDIPRTVELHRGDVVAIKGRNGSGKSTLLKGLMASLGVYDTEEVSQTNTGVYLSPKARVGIYFPDIEVLDELHNLEMRQFVQRISSAKNIGVVMKYWGFDPGQWNTKKLRDIRGADMVARFTFMTLMLKQPNVMILDEPTGSIGEVYRRRLSESLAGYDGALIFVSHDTKFNELVKASHTISMPEGKYSAGSQL